eukprot:CAMPEP_0197930944 /NCGR_PEP_ID=MMETSP1439-20131203/106268_1 /TAXON_ID=66791 /ORGANISM="Gonyaulax spinifera, Strain CCMP409" /LENGTH=45 /DNA_ID= /DNA_START= /DNA_END= /DNA_ORIENTATION=
MEPGVTTARHTRYGRPPDPGGSAQSRICPPLQRRQPAAGSWVDRL